MSSLLEIHPPELIVVLGANGQVGRAWLENQDGDACRGLNRDEANLNQPDAVIALLEVLKPSVVVNAAAYTNVDRAEKEPEQARRINRIAVGELARFCAKSGAVFVHFSTDYVYSGQGSCAWTEEDPTGPISVYGQTKLEGDLEVIEAGGDHLIFRTSWIYDHQGRNFLNTILRLGIEKQALQVVCDQWGAPTYAQDLARASIQALKFARQRAQFPSGVYHLCHSGETSWHGFAEAIFAMAAKRLPRIASALKIQQVEAIATPEYPTPAKRPLNSRLSNEKIHRVLGVRLPDWHEGLNSCLEVLSR